MRRPTGRPVLREFRRADGGVFKNFYAQPFEQAKANIDKLTPEQIFGIDGVKSPEKLKERYTELKTYWEQQKGIMAKTDFEEYILKKLDEVADKVMVGLAGRELKDSMMDILQGDDEGKKQELIGNIIKSRAIIPSINYILSLPKKFPYLHNLLTQIGSHQIGNNIELDSNTVDGAIDEIENFSDGDISGIENDLFFRIMDATTKIGGLIDGIDIDAFGSSTEIVSLGIASLKDSIKDLQGENKDESLIKLYLTMKHIQNPQEALAPFFSE